ncbi:hypothetical protein [Sinomonas soli]
MDLHLIRLVRTGTLDTNPTTFGQRAGTFASAVAQHGAATLLARRDTAGLHGAVLLDGKAMAARGHILLAQTVGARAEQDHLPEGLGDTPAIGRLVHQDSTVLRETQAGIDPGELPRLLASAMPEDSWVAVTMRAPSNRERKHWSAWLAHRLGTAVPTHHSMSQNAMAVTVTAGAATEDQVRALLVQLAAGMPGFDLGATVEFPRTRHRAWLGLPAAAALAALAVFAPSLAAALHGVAGAGEWLPTAQSLLGSVRPFLFVAAAAAFIAGAAAWTGRIPSPDTALRRALAAGAFPAPSTRRGRPALPRRESTVRKYRGDGSTWEKRVPASDGDYPLAPEVFMLGPTVFTAIVSPHAGALSGAAVARTRATPPALLSPVGPVLGTTTDGPAHLPAASLPFGCAIVGAPGSGKSLIVRALFGWHCLERVRPSGRPGHPGRANTLIAFESKGDGVARYQGWAHGLGDTTLVVDVADPTTPALDLFAVRRPRGARGPVPAGGGGAARTGRRRPAGGRWTPSSSSPPLIRSSSGSRGSTTGWWAGRTRGWG